MANQQSTLTVGAGLVAGTKQAFQTIASGMKIVSESIKAQATAMKGLGKGAESKVFANTAKQLDGLNNSLNKQLGIFDEILADQPKVAAGYTKVGDSAQKFGQILNAQGEYIAATEGKMSRYEDKVAALTIQYRELVRSGTSYAANAKEIFAVLAGGEAPLQANATALREINTQYRASETYQKKYEANLKNLTTKYKQAAKDSTQFGAASKRLFANFKAGKIDIDQLKQGLQFLDKYWKGQTVAIDKYAAGIRKLRLSFNGLRQGTDEYAVKAQKVFALLAKGKITIEQAERSLKRLGARKARLAKEALALEKALLRMNRRYGELIIGSNKYGVAARNVIRLMKEKKRTAEQATIALGRLAEMQQKAHVSTTTLGEAFARIGKSIRTYASYIVASSLIFGMIQAFRTAITTIIDYDQALKDVQAITKATAEEMAQISETVKQVASDTKFSAVETAEGFKLLGQSGLSAQEAIETIGAVADLATGTLTSLDTTVDLVTTTMRVFNIESQNSAHIADVYANAVNRSKLTIDKMRTAMNYIGPVAEAAGVSFEETAGAMMIMANQGIRASTIGTGLRQVFRRLVDPSKQMTLALQKAGLTIQDLDPHLNDMSVVLDNLSSVVLTTGDAFHMFGQRGATAVLAITRGKGQALLDMLEIVRQTGAAANMAAIQMEGLGVSFKNLQDKVKNLYIAMGDGGLAGALRVFVDSARVLVDFITGIASNAFVQWASKILLVTVAVRGLMVALQMLVKTSFITALVGPLTKAFAGIAAAATGATTAVTGLRIALFAIGRFIWPVALVSGIIGIISYLTQWDERAQKNLRTLQAEQGQVESSISTLKKFKEEMATFNGTAAEKEEIIAKLAAAYPNMAKEIRGAQGDLEKLNPVLDKHLAILEKEANLNLADQMTTQMQVMKKAYQERHVIKQSPHLFTSDEDIEREYSRISATIVIHQKKLFEMFQSFKKLNPGATLEDFAKAEGLDKGMYAIMVKDMERYMAAVEEAQKRKIEAMATQLGITIKEANEKSMQDPGAISEDYKADVAEEEKVLKESLYKIAEAEALGVKDHGAALKEKTDLTVKHYEELREKAKQYFIDAAATGDADATNQAFLAVTAAEEKLATERLRLLTEYGKKREAAEKKMATQTDKINKETVKNQENLQKQKDAITEGQASHDEGIADKKIELEKDLKETIIDINKDLQTKLADIADKRLEKERSMRADILDIEASTEEKLLKIAQRGMDETQKQLSDEEFARKQFSEAQKAARLAARTGDREAAARAKELFESSSQYFEGLENSSKAAKGVKNVGEELKKLRGITGDLDNADLDTEAQKARTAAEQKKAQAKADSAEALTDFIETEDKKLAKVIETADKAIEKENTRHTNFMTNADAEIAKLQEQQDMYMSLQSDIITDNMEDKIGNQSNEQGEAGNAWHTSPEALEVLRPIWKDIVENGMKEGAKNGLEEIDASGVKEAIATATKEGIGQGIFDGVTVEGMDLETWKEAGKAQGGALGKAMAEEANNKMQDWFLERDADGMVVGVRLGQPEPDQIDDYLATIQTALDDEPGKPQLDFTAAERALQAFIRDAQANAISIPVNIQRGAQYNADGGPVYAMNEGGRLPGISSPRDKLDVKARPGEWFIKNEAVAFWQKMAGSNFMPGVNKPNSRAGEMLQQALKTGMSRDGGGSGDMRSMGKFTINMGSKQAEVAATPMNAKALFTILSKMEAMSS